MDGLRTRFPKPSAEGRRLALQRKFELNVEAYDGDVSMFTLTAPGADVLPWDRDKCHVTVEYVDQVQLSILGEPMGPRMHRVARGPHKCSGELGCTVEWQRSTIFNATAQVRASRLWEAAQRSADRMVRRLYGGELPRQIGHARGVLQLRGVPHWHYLLPQGSETERAWSRHVWKYMQRQAEHEQRLGPEAVWAAIEQEFTTGEITRGVYGFGFVHPGRGQAARGNGAARYVARNAANYVSGQAAGHYVSSRLTRRTGITMRLLRSVNYLHVRRKLINAGKLVDEWVPTYWEREYAEKVLGLYGRLQPQGP